MIVADTSFLFSLFGHDTNTATAQNWARWTKQPVGVTALNRFEFGNAVRLAVFRGAISEDHAVSSLAAFEADLKLGMLRVASCDLLAVLSEAERLSERHTSRGGHRAFDILHVASASVLKAAAFLTFDQNQRKLAETAGIPVGP